MKLSDKKINDVWKSGYCRATVDHAAQTDNSATGSRRRIAFLTAHVDKCSDCGFAALLKAMEAEVAERIGSRAVAGFFRGENTVAAPGYRSNMVRDAIEELRRAGHVTPEFKGWMKRVSARGNYPD